MKVRTLLSLARYTLYKEYFYVVYFASMLNFIGFIFQINDKYN